MSSPVETSPLAQRGARLEALAGHTFDLLVVGGGITGSGIARDAALRGLAVALVEKDDFASGTSSRSSRLIHGGVRYLEHGHLRLVFEASAERRRLLHLAPHLVHSLEFLWPIYAGARVPRWKLAAGLTLYDLLALFRNVGRHRQLGPRAVHEREPRLRDDGLVGGARYFDAATDDARLTLANAIGAMEAGAVVVNHAAVRTFRTSDGAVSGALVVDVLTGTTREVRARVVVNATGPWSDELRRLDQGTTASTRAAVRGSKGVHLAVPSERIGNRGALTLLSPRDGRVMFVLPAGRHTIIGTTDTFTTSSPDEVRASEADVRYLLDSANSFFPDARLTPVDVVSAWAGIRPLISGTDEGGANPSAVSREHAITRSAQGVVTITGGKLTTYRVMAGEVVDAVQQQLGQSAAGHRAPTRTRPLPGGDISSVDRTEKEAGDATGDAEIGRHLARAHGSRWHAVWEEMRAHPLGRERVVAELPYTFGELRYAVRHEMALTLADLLVRRTHLTFETRDHGLHVAPTAARAVADLLGWDDAAVQRAVEEFAREVARIFGIDRGA